MPLVLLFGLVLSTSSASPYTIDPWVDGLGTALPYTLLIAIEAGVKPSLDGGITCREVLDNGRCDPQNLHAFDRYAVDKKSKTWGRISDIAGNFSFFALALDSGLQSLGESGWDGKGFGKDLLVSAQAIGLATLTTTLFKFALRRPRPTQYSDGRFVGSIEHQLSFPSGHVTGAAAGSAAWITTTFLRRPKGLWRYVVLGCGLLATGLTAYGRIGAGMHFPTDVIGGFAVGALFGTVVPLWHTGQNLHVGANQLVYHF